MKKKITMNTRDGWGSVTPSPVQQISVENVINDKPNESFVDALQQVPTSLTSL